MCTQCPIQLVELPIYGLGRVGVAKPTGIVLNTPANTGPTYSRPIGEKFYELADHLGNVRMVISDIKRSMLTGTVPGKFFADVHAYMNAYPYGMPMPGRWWDSALAASPRATYRYGYNGMEADPEVLGEGNHFTTPFREYDPRVARWWSNDPIVHPWESPYAAMGGNPVRFTDPLGLDTSIFDEANDYEREVRKGGRDMLIVRASRLKEETPSSSPEAREEATQQENLANAQRAWGATKDRLSAVLDADYARRDRENSSVGQDISWHIQDLLNLGVVGLSDPKYLERGIVRCQTCDFVPGISLIRAGLVIKSDGLTFESGLGLAAAGLNTVPVAGMLDDAGRLAGSGVKAIATRPNAIGKVGETAVRAAVDIGSKVRIIVAGRTRIPDGLTDMVLSEVKNVSSLSYTQQLRDFATFAQQTGRQFHLYVRSNTQLSGPLQDAVTSGVINLRFIP